MNDLMVFKNEEFGEIRTASIEGEPWFVGKDIAEQLGYGNTRDALIAHVDEDDKQIIQKSDFPTFEIPNRGMILINESGLYSLILSSKLPTAKKFKHWVTSEVLPAIRKHGLYVTPKTLAEMLKDPDSVTAILEQLKAEQARVKELREENALQNQRIAELQPKASYYDVVLNSPDLVAISVIAKDYGWSANRMNKELYRHGVQYKQGSIWLLYQKYAEQGYTHTKTGTHPGVHGDVHTHVHTYWTQKGRLFIYDLLKADGILPSIERE